MATSSQREQARTALAVLEDLVGQVGLVFDGAEAELEEEVRDAREEAYGLHAVLLGFFDQRAKDAAAGAVALGRRRNHDGAHLGQMRAVEMQRAAAQKDAAIGLGDGEVADVLADLREGGA